MSKLEIISIDKSFGKKQVLHQVNFKLEEGQLYGLLGRNGAGKSTLLSIINNRIIGDEGEVLLDNENVLENDELLSEIFLVNDSCLFGRDDSMQAKDYFNFAKLVYDDFDTELMERLISIFGLDVKMKLAKLSTGYKSIFNIILALCVPCKFIFLDEPTLGLDANHRDIFYKELVATFIDKPRSFILSTHLISEIANVINSVIVLDEGQIILEETVDHILAKAWSVKGPKEKMESLLNEPTIIGFEEMGEEVTVYCYGKLPELPNDLTVDRVDLQKMFIQFTSGKEVLTHED